MNQDIKDIIKDERSDKFKIAQALWNKWGIQPKEIKKPYKDE